MKRASFLILCLVLIGSASVPTQAKKIKTIRQYAPAAPTQLKQGLGCSTCVTFLDDSLNTLLNIILNLGLGATCSTLCGELPTQLEQTVCMFFCVAVGFEEFVNVLNNTDLDPVFDCAELGICPANDCNGQCTNITSITVNPPKGPVRTTFKVNVVMDVLKPTGTGVTRVIVFPPGQQPLAFETLNEGFAANTVAKAEIDIETDWEDWTWPAGNYPIEVDSCGYDCDDQHGTYFSKGYGSFQITGSN